MPLKIIRNDISKVSADVIVNSANPKPKYGTGTDYAIYNAAGVDDLLAERRRIGDISVGDIAVTPAFKLDAKYIIHTVGPVWNGGQKGELDDLKSCYQKSLDKACELECQSIAFPLISTGVYLFPKDKALKVAISTITDFLFEHDMDVYLVVFDDKSFEVSGKLFNDIDSYISDNIVSDTQDNEYGHLFTHPISRAFDITDKEHLRQIFDFNSERRRRENHPEDTKLEDTKPEDIKSADSKLQDTETKNQKSADSNLSDKKLYETKLEASKPADTIPTDEKQETTKPEVTKITDPQNEPMAPSEDLDSIVSSVDKTYQQRLLELIDGSGMTDAEVYKKANLDRKLFSKIRCNPDYTPKKKTAVALAIALELPYDEMTDLLGRAGIAFSKSSQFDLIIEYFVKKGVYDVQEINLALFKHKQDTLGA